ncbi:uncharacterized protein C1orf159 homolog isoform X3 [Rana temporaria]|uniref:uncharacterized protein C1orf159 homolog isoform X3 n=1 Tax=Rana temporaria TaxID=8407 RepID=UPI001AADB917|nr:uncharacterized protein C1orf159 homolog isoform X3 [Rana temporaria]
MAVPCIILLGRLIVESVGESVNSLVSDCCSEKLVLNGTCPAEQRCSPGCFQIWTSNGGTSCIKCANDSSQEVAYNLTECTNITTQALEIHMNHSTTPSSPHHLTSILQPSEMASMIPNPSFTGRKPRYVRRERTHKSSAPVLLASSEDTQVSNV